MNDKFHTTRQMDEAGELQISEETRTLIECRAKLGDILETISAVIDRVYGNPDETIRDYETGIEGGFEEFDRALSDFIKYHVDRTMMENVFKLI